MENNNKEAIFLTEKLCKEEPKLETQIARSIDLDIVLPDYYPDISKLLCYDMDCKIVNQKIDDGKVCLEASYLGKIFYSCEENKIHCICQEGSLKLECEAPIPKDNSNEAITIIPSCKLKFLSSRAISPRRFELRAELLAEVLLVCSEEKEIVSTSQSKNLQLKAEKKDISCLKKSSIYKSQLNHPLRLGEGYGKLSEIISYDLCYNIYESSALGGRIIVKGEILVNALLLGENKNEPFEARLSAPISEIISDEDGAEDMELMISLDGEGLSLELGALSQGLTDELILNGSLIFSYTLSQKKEALLAKDCYHIKNNCQIKKEELSFLSSCKKFNESVSLSESIKLDFDAEKIVYSYFTSSYKGFSKEDGNILIMYQLCYHFFLLNSKGELVHTAFSKDEKLSIPMACQNEKLYLSVCFRPQALSSSLDGKNQIKAKAELKASGLIYSFGKEEIILDICLGDKKEKPSDKCSLKIYFGEKGERLWDIGKSFNTSIDAIISENDEPMEVLEENKMLIIPIL